MAKTTQINEAHKQKGENKHTAGSHVLPNLHKAVNHTVNFRCGVITREAINLPSKQGGETTGRYAQAAALLRAALPLVEPRRDTKCGDAAR